MSPRTPGARPSMGRADGYFSPQIDDGSNYPQSNKPGYGGFGDVDSDPASAYLATSPKRKGPNFLDRFQGIAAGPYADEPAAKDLPRFPRKPSEDRGRLSPSGFAPPRKPKNTGYGGFGPPGADDAEFGAPNRAETFSSQPNDRLEPPFRAPSAPGPRPERLRDTSRLPPPRTSLVRIRTKNSINLDAEFGSDNPYHSTSPSTESSLSRGSSRISQPSVSTSPARSATSGRKRYDNSPTNDSQFESLLDEVSTSAQDTRMKNLPPTPDLDRESAQARRLAPASSERYDPAIQGGPPSPPASKWDRGDRQDPAVQGGRRTDRSRDPLRSPLDAPRRAPPAQKSRGNCRACGDAITGKSVSSADGRLTGRYHKACFACTSCFEPFPTAEFYVHDDRPYCKRHYHRVNGSVCGTCKEGIEGQYLEDESGTKYHVQCFRCGDCDRVLSDGYFEVNGQAFCERDAWRRLQSTRRTPSMSSQGSQSSQRSYGSSPLAPPGRPGMRLPPSQRPGIPSRPMPKGVGLAPPGIPKLEKRMTRLGMMGGF